MTKREYSLFKNHLNIVIDTKQHFNFNIISDEKGKYASLIIKLFIISFYIDLPFNIKATNKYGIGFDSYNTRWWPDFFFFNFGKKSFISHLVSYHRQYNRYYETRMMKEMHLKDIKKNNKTKNSFKYNSIIKAKNNRKFNVLYYREHHIYKHKLFKWWLNYDTIHNLVLSVEFVDDHGNIKRTKSIIVDNPEEPIQDSFQTFLSINNYTIV